MHNTIEYGKSEHGYEFPIYDGQLLSWHLSLTWEDEQAGFPKMRTVIRAMMERRPEQLNRERYEMLKGSFDKIFGHNARKVLDVIDSEIVNVTILDNQDDPQAIPVYGQPSGVYESPEAEDETEQARR